ncbi:antitoxin HicB [Companilactobacillus ginsenosidimutans]|uniref:Antitoxin HicB n=2 Tax=Companilactobacillus ginsenosidimutans TaxID=1007676 RepID=A0A0H4QMR8_9LACO|nr:antitoxin HicB [Companilactobacillus ginsenosidimutans]
MKNGILLYPVIISEYNDDGHYYVATSPNIPGMITQGTTLTDTAYWTEDAIATMINGSDYPETVDPSNWKLKDNDKLVYITVDMTRWIKKNTRTVKKTITVPEYISNLAKKNNINVSKVATDALKRALNIDDD